MASVVLMVVSVATLLTLFEQKNKQKVLRWDPSDTYDITDLLNDSSQT